VDHAGRALDQRLYSPATMSALELARHWASAARHRLRRGVPERPVPSPDELPRHRRYLSDRPERMEAYLLAAREYVARLSEADRAWLYRKPFDVSTGHPAFFDEMYGIMNLLRAMGITPRGRVLEVGSGPGWVTEILLALGYEVDAVEPSADMIAIARERVDHARRHYRLGDSPRAEFHAEPLETCSLPGDAFDAVIFHAALHHVVDEEKGLGQCFRLLRPGGVLGVSEGAWIPGDRFWEEKLEEEMRQFGALENPFTAEYLDFLLRRHGFVDIRRYYAVNGLFAVEMGDRRIAKAATYRPWDGNNLTARKPAPYAATTLDPSARTEAEIEVLESALDRASGIARLKVRLVNRGETAWLAEAASRGVGWVSIALRRGEPGSPRFLEGASRHRLPRTLPPGEEVVLDVTFRLPADSFAGAWFLDLVNEEVFWFSSRGTRAAAVRWE
jgi:SAM-dependent methyltransferase